MVEVSCLWARTGTMGTKMKKKMEQRGDKWGSSCRVESKRSPISPMLDELQSKTIAGGTDEVPFGEQLV